MLKVYFISRIFVFILLDAKLQKITVVTTDHPNFFFQNIKIKREPHFNSTEKNKIKKKHKVI